jgi:hypothetical protein
MKKRYSILISLLPIVVSAQITVTQSDLPGVGSFYINANDSNYTDPITPGGANQNWNYSTLQNIVQDTLGFIAAAGTPYSANFPMANLSAFDAPSNSYVYFISNATGFYLNGAVSPGNFNGIPLIYNPAQVLVPVPFTYNDTHNSYYRFEYNDTATFLGTLDSVRFILHTSENIIADGYGTLNLPNGSHPNTLRLKNTLLETDSFMVKLPLVGWTTVNVTQAQTTNFRWVQNGGGTLLLSVDGDSLGINATTSSYLLNYGVLGLNEGFSNVAVSVYPNPSSQFVTINFGETTPPNSKLIITNALGEQVESFDASAVNKITVVTINFINGVYFYSMNCKNGISSKGKFVVKR